MLGFDENSQYYVTNTMIYFQIYSFYRPRSELQTESTRKTERKWLLLN